MHFSAIFAMSMVFAALVPVLPTLRGASRDVVTTYAY